jgi:hypothetical protein
MDRLTVGPDARRKRDIAWLCVGETRLDIPQTIFALIGFRTDCATMAQLTGDWRGKRHAGGKAGLENQRILAYWVFEAARIRQPRQA